MRLITLCTILCCSALTYAFADFSVRPSQQKLMSDDEVVIMRLGESCNRYGIMFIPVEKQLICDEYDEVSNKFCFCIWDFKKRKKVKSFFTTFKWRVDQLAVSPNGKFVALIDVRGHCKVYSVSNGNEINAFEHFANHPTYPRGIQFLDNETVFSVGAAGVGNKWVITSNRVATYLLSNSQNSTWAAAFVSPQSNLEERSKRVSITCTEVPP